MSTTISLLPPKTTSLRADFIWTLVGNSVYAAGQWAVLMILAKLTRPELVGQYALGFAIAIPVFMLASLQLRLTYVADVHQQTHFGYYLSLRLFFTALGLLVILASTQLLGFHHGLRWVVLMVGMSQAIENVSDIYYARLQLHDRMISIAKSQLARTPLSLLGLALGLYLSGSLLWGIAAMMLARIAVLIGYDMRRRTHDLPPRSQGFSQGKELNPHWDLKVQRQLFWCAVPIGTAQALATFNPAIPRYFIEHALGDRALGIFSAITLIFAAGSMALVSLGYSAFARLARAYANEDLRQFKALLVKLVLFGAAMGTCGIVISKLAGRRILTMLFRPEYAQHADLLTWIMAAGCVGYMAQALGIGMSAARFFRSQVVLFTITNLSIAVACYVLVPVRGLSGAVLAMLISMIVQLAGSIIILTRGMHKSSRQWAKAQLLRPEVEAA